MPGIADLSRIAGILVGPAGADQAHIHLLHTCQVM